MAGLPGRGRRGERSLSDIANFGLTRGLFGGLTTAFKIQSVRKHSRRMA